MIDVIIKNIWTIFGSILLACFTAHLFWRHFQKTRRLNAADKFSQIIHTEFKGLYPIPTNWPEHSSDIIPILKKNFRY